MNDKILTVITINKNNKEGLEDTIKSVVNQTFFDKVNFIIIDGNSTDGSKEIVEKYKDKLFHYVSEDDRGIYNAMNKGIRASVSPYLLFLNSGDHLIENNVLERVFPYLDGTDILYGNEWKVNDKYKNYKAYEAKYPDKLDESFFRGTSLPHQSSFIKRELLDKGYDEDFKIISDWKLFIEAFRNGKTFKHMPFMVSVYDCSGFSFQNLSLMQQEKNEFYRTCAKRKES